MLGLRQYRSTAIDLWCGDITHFSCDVIVNAANTALSVGGGVCGAVHRVGGPEVTKECEKIGKCEVGKAVATTAGYLPAERLVHTVGPIWEGGKFDEAKLLTNAYHSALKIVVQKDWQHTAFPAISTGAFGYPKLEAAKVAINSVKSFIDKKPPGTMRRITFVLFDTATYGVFQSALQEVFGLD